MTQVEIMKKKLAKLREAIIKAREIANSTEIEQQKGADKLFNFIFE